MHDFTVNQAAGLQGLTTRPGAQLIAMVSHGDDAAELPLLWKMCSILVEMGYPVTVLDGTSTEGDDNPGLEQLLNHAFRPHNDSSPESRWTVYPAAIGLGDLCEGSSAVHRLGAFFDPEDLVIAYGSAQVLATLLVDTRSMPLLSVSNSKNSLLTSYLALKRLLITGHLTPLIANFVHRDQRQQDPLQSSKLKNLMVCANNFLGFDTKVFQVAVSANEIADLDDVRRLTLGLLESAVTLSQIAPIPFNAGTMESVRFTRNH